MDIITFFSDKGSPKTGLLPGLTIWDSTGTLHVNNATMTEINGGFYKYEFGGYIDGTDYCFRADGGIILEDTDRYLSGTNEITPNDCADAVWDEQRSEHVVIGSAAVHLSNIETAVGTVDTKVDTVDTVVDTLNTKMDVVDSNVDLTLIQAIIARKLLRNKATISNDRLSVTIFEDDKVTPLVVYSISEDKLTKSPV